MVLSTLINHPERLNRETLYELRTLVARYPYFQTARILLLNNLYLLHEADFGAELQRSILYISDRRVMSRLVEGYKDRVDIDDDAVSDNNTETDRTFSLIDAFLGTLPDEQLSLQLSSEASADYALRYLSEDNPSESSIESPFGEHSVIDSYLSLSASDPMQPLPMLDATNAVATSSANSLESVPEHADEHFETSPDEMNEESLDESYFTETLAKIYIKQHKYSRALEIIRSLYLKYPEKNIYFADQIRFLEKLIINNNSK